MKSSESLNIIQTAEDDRSLADQCINAIRTQRQLALYMGMPSASSYKSFNDGSVNSETWIRRAWAGYRESIGLRSRSGSSEGKMEVLESLKRIPSVTALQKIVKSLQEQSDAIVKFLVRCDRRPSDRAINECLLDTRLLADWTSWYVTLRNAFSPQVLAKVTLTTKNSSVSLTDIFEYPDSDLNLSCLAVWDCMPLKLYNNPTKLLDVRDTICSSIFDSLSFLIQNVANENVLYMILSNNLINSLLKHSHDIILDVKYLDHLDPKYCEDIATVNSEDDEFIELTEDFSGRSNYDLVSSLVSFCKALTGRMDATSLDLLAQPVYLEDSTSYSFILLKTVLTLIDHDDLIIASHCRNALMQLVVLVLQCEDPLPYLSIPINNGTANASLFQTLSMVAAVRIQRYDVSVMNSAPRHLLEVDLPVSDKIPSITARSISIEHLVSAEKQFEDNQGWPETPRRPVICTAVTSDTDCNGRAATDRVIDLLDFIGELFSSFEGIESPSSQWLPLGEIFIRDTFQFYLTNGLIHILYQLYHPDLCIHELDSSRIPDLRSPYAVMNLRRGQNLANFHQISPLTILKVVSLMLNCAPLSLCKPLIDLVFVSTEDAFSTFRCAVKPRHYDARFAQRLTSTNNHQVDFLRGVVGKDTTLLDEIIRVPFSKEMTPLLSLIVAVVNNSQNAVTRSLKYLWESNQEECCQEWNSALTSTKKKLMDYCSTLSHMLVTICQQTKSLVQLNAIRGWILYSSNYMKNLSINTINRNSSIQRTQTITGLSRLKSMLATASRNSFFELVSWIYVSENLIPLEKDESWNDAPFNAWDIELWQNLLWIFLEEHLIAMSCGKLTLQQLPLFTEALDLMAPGHTGLAASLGEQILKQTWSRIPKISSIYCQDISAFHWKWALPTGFKRIERAKQHVRFLIQCLSMFQMYNASLGKYVDALSDKHSSPLESSTALLDPVITPQAVYDSLNIEDIGGELIYRQVASTSPNEFSCRALLYCKHDDVKLVSDCDTIEVEMVIHAGRLIFIPINGEPKISSRSANKRKKSPTKSKSKGHHEAALIPLEPMEVPLECISVNINEYTVPKERLSTLFGPDQKMVHLELFYSIVQLKPNIKSIMMPPRRKHIPHVRLSHLPYRLHSKLSDQLRDRRGTLKLIMEFDQVNTFRKIALDETQKRIQVVCRPIFNYLKGVIPEEESSLRCTSLNIDDGGLNST
eukprot:GHVH01004183.1.p1 GENE.GHVH01004183.1~~GHVH01004183.1.p1  ORF type:complete len:1215 (+),score=154.68 GHVH01004183.1:29-3646(+)